MVEPHRPSPYSLFLLTNDKSCRLAIIYYREAKPDTVVYYGDSNRLPGGSEADIQSHELH